VALLWAAALCAAPYLARHSAGAVAVVYLLGSLICHQQPERSFHLDGARLPVCARCLGLYVGVAAGAAMWMGRTILLGGSRPWPRGYALRTLVLAAVPTIVTVATASVGLADASNLWRAVLAVPLGFTAGSMVAAVLTSHLK
jgi:uncharacterized membrane protein